MNDGRNETEDEKLDRKRGDLLQELRVMQTGAQLTAGFLLTLPFTTKFPSLDDFQQTLFLVLVVVAALTTAVVITPVAVHRRISGEHVKERLVKTAHRLVGVGLTLLAVLVTGIVVLIFDVVVDRTTALVIGAVIAAILACLLVALPHKLVSTTD